MPRTQNPTFGPRLLIFGGILVLIAAIVLVVYQNNAPAASLTPTADIPWPEVERVSLADAKTALDRGTAVFLDVRGADVYALSRIPGALSIPLEELEARLGELDPAQWIITYCT